MKAISSSFTWDYSTLLLNTTVKLMKIKGYMNISICSQLSFIHINYSHNDQKSAGMNAKVN